MTGANAEFFMKSIHPYCIIKGPQIDMALMFRSTYRQPRGVLQTDEIIAEKRGVVLALKEAKRA
jgi:hypothetical protein